MTHIILIVMTFALMACTASLPPDGVGGSGSTASSTTASGYSVLGACHRVKFADTCHADKPIAVECTDDKAPAQCELHNLAPDYFCCP